MAGVDTAVDDPFYGLNVDLAHARVGGYGDPLIQLHLDHQPRVPDHRRGGQEAYFEGTERPGAHTIWIHRPTTRRHPRWERPRHSSASPRTDIWCELVAMATELTAWIQPLALDGSARAWGH